jgi:hypothetical protein
MSLPQHHGDAHPRSIVFEGYEYKTLAEHDPHSTQVIDERGKLYSLESPWHIAGHYGSYDAALDEVCQRYPWAAHALVLSDGLLKFTGLTQNSSDREELERTVSNLGLKYLTQENGQFGAIGQEQQQLLFEQEILEFRERVDKQRGIVERDDLKLQQLRAHHADCVGKLEKLRHRRLELIGDLEQLVAQQHEPGAEESIQIELALLDAQQIPAHHGEVAIADEAVAIQMAIQSEYSGLLEALTRHLQILLPSAHEALASLTFDVLIRRKL